MSIRKSIFVTIVFAGVLSFGQIGSAQETGIRGFLDEEVNLQRQREEMFRSIPEPTNLREYMRIISESPHHAGAPGSRRVAEYILSQFASWGLEAYIEEYEALMPFPVERVVELIKPERIQLRLEEPAIPEDQDSGDIEGLPNYNAYSADGDVTAELVYVNYGLSLIHI